MAIFKNHRPATSQTSRNSSTRQDVVDNQGNPIDTDGNLIVETITSISEITDQDFETPTRSIVLPTLPDNVSNAIGTNGRAVIIKKNVFEKNGNTHVELEPSDSREILQSALYNTNIVGSTQPIKRPDYKVAIRTGEKNAVVVLDVFQGKEYVEIVGWRKVDEKGLKKMQRQAEREGGQFLILSPNDGSAAALSALPSGASSTGKDTTSSLNSNNLDENVLSTLKGNIENLRAKAEIIEYELDYLADNINNQFGYNFRDGIDLYKKTFIKADGSRYVHFESVTVKKDNLEVAISSHEVNESALTKKVQQSKLLHLNSKFLNSDGRLIEPLNEGSDLVPAPNSVSDSNKSVSSDKDTTSSLNNNILDENVLSTLKEDIENLRAKAETIEYELDYLAENINNQLGYDFRDGIDLYKKTFIKLGANKLKTLKWFRDNVSDNKEYPNLIFDFAKTLNQIVILESQLKRSDDDFDTHIATLPTGDAIQAITQRRGAEEADQYAQWRKGILTKERDKAHKTLNAKHKPFDPSRYTDYAQMKREERKHNEAIQATRNEALNIIQQTTAEIAHIDSYLANRNRQIAAEREAENPLRNGIAPAVAKLSINTLEQYIARYIALGGRLRMSDQYSNGLAAELGITPGSQEHRELLSILSNTEGMTPEQLAHDISENIEPEYRHLIAGRDVQDIRNAIIDTIASGVTSRRRAYQYIADANEKLSADEQRYIEEQELQAQIDADTEQAIRDYEELLLSSLSPQDLAIIDAMAGDYWDEILTINQEAYNSLISPSAYSSSASRSED